MILGTVTALVLACAIQCLGDSTTDYGARVNTFDAAPLVTYAPDGMNDLQGPFNLTTDAFDAPTLVYCTIDGDTNTLLFSLNNGVPLWTVIPSLLVSNAPIPISGMDLTATLQLQPVWSSHSLLAAFTGDLTTFYFFENMRWHPVSLNTTLKLQQDQTVVYGAGNNVVILVQHDPAQSTVAWRIQFDMNSNSTASLVPATPPPFNLTASPSTSGYITTDSVFVGFTSTSQLFRYTMSTDTWQELVGYQQTMSQQMGRPMSHQLVERNGLLFIAYYTSFGFNPDGIHLFSIDPSTGAASNYSIWNFDNVLRNEFPVFLLPSVLKGDVDDDTLLVIKVSVPLGGAYQSIMVNLTSRLAYANVNQINTIGVVDTHLVPTGASSHIAYMVGALFVDGYSFPSGYCDVFMLDVSLLSISQINVLSGTPPHQRVGAAVAFVNASSSPVLLVHGGYFPDESIDHVVYADAFLFDLTRLQWRPLATGPHLARHASVMLDNNRWFLATGFTGVHQPPYGYFTADAWIYTLASDSWLLLPRALPAPLIGATAAILGTRVFVGGPNITLEVDENYATPQGPSTFDFYSIALDCVSDAACNWTHASRAPVNEAAAAVSTRMVTQMSNASMSLFFCDNMGNCTGGLMRFYPYASEPVDQWQSVPFAMKPARYASCFGCLAASIVVSPQEDTATNTALPRLFITQVVRPYPPNGFVSLACSLGQVSANISMTPCLPCALGTYADRLGMTECIACPAATTTADTGAQSVLDCRRCADDQYCNGHGSCYLAGGSPTCDCESIYSGSELCTTPWVVVYVSISVASALVFVLVVYISNRMLQRSRRHKQELMASLSRVEELERSWIIDYATLRLGERVGSGASGVVWRGTWGEITVAVKQLADPFADDSELDREAAAVRALRHENIVLFYGAGRDDNGAAFFVTEFLARGSLRDVLDDATLTDQLTWDMRLALARDGARGMEFLHSRGVLHRDLKSLNLLVSANWRLKVADLGSSRKTASRVPAPSKRVGLLGRLLGRNSQGRGRTPSAGVTGHNARQGSVQQNASADCETLVDSGAREMGEPLLTDHVGTVLWMPPELLLRQSTASPASDIYSYGIVLWEISTGRLPFDHIDSFEVFQAVSAHNARPQWHVDDTVVRDHPAFKTLIETCWLADPRARPAFEIIALRLAMME